MISHNDYYTINQKDQLLFHYYKDDKRITLNLEDLYIDDCLDIKDYYISEKYPIYTFTLSNSKITLYKFLFPIKLKKNNIIKNIKLCSNTHLEKLIKKYEYKNPYYYSKVDLIDILITKDNIQTIKPFGLNIVIKDKNFEEYYNELEQKFKNIYNKYESFKNENIKKNQIFIPPTYDLVSSNFNKYFKNNNNFNISKDFIYIDSTQRASLIEEIKQFIKNEKANIYALTSPYGSGKSLVALIIHKNLYIKGHLSLYINFKYYSKKYISWNDKIDTLLSECFFLFKDFSLLKELAIKIQTNYKSDIWSLLSLIKEFLIEKNISPIFIFDQHQESIDKILSYQNFKIFLLSSNDDKDVKNQFVLKLSSKPCLIDYNYYSNLIPKKLLENLISNYETKDNIDGVIAILKKFGYLPKFIFSFLYYYNSIYELVFEEYRKIFFQIRLFFSDKNNYLILKNLCLSNPLIYSKEQFIKYINDIPLKYIKYMNDESNDKEDIKNKLCLKYAFDFCEIVYKNYINYRDALNSFSSGQVFADIGINFETIIKTEIILFQLLNVDGCIKVNECLNLDLIDMYERVNSNYFYNKKNILIVQTKNNGKLLDFVIYRPETQIAFFIQVKYKITNSLEYNKNTYYKEAKNFISKFRKVFKVELKNIYLLYFSSIKYNIDRKEEVFEILERKQIKCLFYSVNTKNFYFNFLKGSNVFQLEENNSYRIYPRKYGNYEKRNIIIPLIRQSEYKKDYKFVEDTIKNLEENSIEKKEYSSFIEFLSLNSMFSKEDILIFKPFICFCSNNYFYNFVPDISLYFVHCSLKDDKIDFSSEIGLIYPGYDKILYYFDLIFGKPMTKTEYFRKFKKYGFFMGIYDFYSSYNE